MNFCIYQSDMDLHVYVRIRATHVSFFHVRIRESDGPIGRNDREMKRLKHRDRSQLHDDFPLKDEITNQINRYMPLKYQFSFKGTVPFKGLRSLKAWVTRRTKIPQNTKGIGACAVDP